MIKSITMKNVATFDDEGVPIDDLKKVNFFFGFNGSGKSTIAKYLHNSSLEENLRGSDFEHCTQNSYDDSNHQILTFDENFTEVNFNKRPLLKGVFSLNEKNELIDKEIKEEGTKIKSLQDSKERKEKLITKIQDDKGEKQTTLHNTCWKERNTFLTFTKINLDYPGSKPNHLQELENILLENILLENISQEPLVDVSTIEQLTTDYNTLYEKEISEITIMVSLEFYKEIRIIERKLEGLLSEVIIGNEDVDIATLIKKLDTRNWVETGVKYLEQKNDICPFCQQQTITDNLKQQFSELFDETYKEKIKEIERLFALYKQESSSLLSNISDIKDAYNPDNLVSDIHIKLKELFDSNFKIIADKVKNSNEKKSLISLNTIKSKLSGIIKSIKQNNTTFSKLDESRSTLIAGIWSYMAQQCQPDIEIFNTKRTKYKRIITRAKRLISGYGSKELTTQQTIETLRSGTVNTKAAVDSINLILKSTGFEGFEVVEVVEKDTVNNISQYYLQRNGSTDEENVFKSLSEGEKSFISFLYFFQLCVGTDDIANNSTKKKIVVIDDPVSSLDSQSLFVVSTLIHQLILRKGDDSKERKLFKNTNISQVFVLTHNLYFYKEVSFERRPICTDFWHYKINKINNITKISGNYKRKVFDDYSLLWQTLKDINGNLPTDNSLNIVIANTMRRVIESFVNFIGLEKHSWGAVLSENQEKPSYYIKCSFISTINDGSHKVTVFDSIYYQKITNEQPQLLFDVFKEIFISIGKEHYEMMMGKNIET